MRLDERGQWGAPPASALCTLYCTSSFWLRCWDGTGCYPDRYLHPCTPYFHLTPRGSPPIVPTFTFLSHPPQELGYYNKTRLNGFLASLSSSVLLPPAAVPIPRDLPPPRGIPGTSPTTAATSASWSHHRPFLVPSVGHFSPSATLNNKRLSPCHPAPLIARWCLIHISAFLSPKSKFRSCIATLPPFQPTYAHASPPPNSHESGPAIP